MALLSTITDSNDHRVNFKKPIRKFQFIKLLSCSLYNSWYTLNKQGKIIFQISKSHLDSVEYLLFLGIQHSQSGQFFLKIQGGEREQHMLKK